MANSLPFGQQRGFTQHPSQGLTFNTQPFGTRQVAPPPKPQPVPDFVAPTSPSPDLYLRTTDGQRIHVSSSLLRIHSPFFDRLFREVMTAPFNQDELFNGDPVLPVDAPKAALNLLLLRVAMLAPPSTLYEAQPLSTLIEAYNVAEMWEAQAAKAHFVELLTEKSASSTLGAQDAIAGYRFCAQRGLPSLPEKYALRLGKMVPVLENPFFFEESLGNIPDHREIALFYRTMRKAEQQDRTSGAAVAPSRVFG